MEIYPIIPQRLDTGASPTFVGATFSGLTPGRVLFVGTGGIISDDAGMTYSAANDVLTLAGSAPIYDLNLTDTTAQGKLKFSENGTRIGELQVIGSTFAEADRRGNMEFFLTGSGNDIFFATNSLARMRIKQGGAVKFGSGSSTRGDFDVDVNGNIWLTKDGLQCGTQAVYLAGHILLSPYGTGDICYLQARRSDSSGTTQLQLRTYNAGALVNAMLIKNTGNVSVSGVYEVDDTQVVGNRVVDARCDDAINSGDATTDGVIDSLRDAMIAHGLLAAA